ncbi:MULTISPECIES: hypothetical protein [unclassified Phenylobacterium]|jgi:hypothetical protein|uniref:hypothetical protein n=1 Tax=unclassified Phenylobacterium TaxID=2640670 RepID=UPI000A9E1B37|nr:MULTISPECIES: hypothetical protein [unclassified Phenylobacterium]
MKVLATTVFVVGLASASAAETPAYVGAQASAAAAAAAPESIALLDGPDFIIDLPPGDPWGARAVPRAAELPPG